MPFEDEPWLGWAANWAGGGGWEPYDPVEPPEPEKPAEPDKRKKRQEGEEEEGDGEGDESALADKSGLVLGRFDPPHEGHRFLVDFAQRIARHLTVLVIEAPGDRVAGSLRAAWLRELFPTVQVLLATVPSRPPTDASGLRAWVEIVRRHVPEGPRYFFASESGAAFAAALGAALVPVDPARVAIPVSSTAIESEPQTYWRWLTPPARAYLARRVAIVGPAGSGKTTLAAALAKRFDTVWVPEYARTWSEHARALEPADLALVARAQLAAEDALARAATRLLVCDTSLLQLALWAEITRGSCPRSIARKAREPRYDLTIVTPGPFSARFVSELAKARVPFMAIAGSPEQRLERAANAIDELLAEKDLLGAYARSSTTR
jgi:HTH-type transcriptional regulator, transcriptional repressor of NAD biosynthesis genes